MKICTYYLSFYEYILHDICTCKTYRHYMYVNLVPCHIWSYVYNNIHTIMRYDGYIQCFPITYKIQYSSVHDISPTKCNVHTLRAYVSTIYTWHSTCHMYNVGELIHKRKVMAYSVKYCIRLSIYDIRMYAMYSTYDVCRGYDMGSIMTYYIRRIIILDTVIR